jgi:hypothetical protein
MLNTPARCGQKKGATTLINEAGRNFNEWGKNFNETMKSMKQ